MRSGGLEPASFTLVGMVFIYYSTGDACIRVLRHSAFLRLLLHYYSTILRCRRSFNVSIGLDEAFCPDTAVVLVQDINSTPNTPSARCPFLGLKWPCRKRLLRLPGRWERLIFSCAYFPVLAGRLSLNGVTGDCVHPSSDSQQMLEPIFVPNMG